LRHGQDGQTVGIPVGPDASRYVAEVIGAAIDAEFVRRGGAADTTVIRHVDDVWIGADTHAEAEAALWRYRESIRAFELDINESKTRIYSDDFQFSDSWPTDIAAKIEFALASPARGHCTKVSFTYAKRERIANERMQWSRTGLPFERTLSKVTLRPWKQCHKLVIGALGRAERVLRIGERTVHRMHKGPRAALTRHHGLGIPFVRE
jgi:hypothetical protein